MNKAFRSILFLLFALLIGCGGDGGSPAVPTDGLLPGDGTDLAILHVVNYDDTRGVEQADVVMAPDGRHIALTQLEIWLEDSATVAAVNQVLLANGARIISMITNVPILLLEVSRPEDYAALNMVAERLASSPAIKKVDFVDMTFPGSLPLNHSDSDITALNDIYQLIATKNLAARNAKSALDSSLAVPPTIIVVDYFGDGRPGPAFDIVTDDSDYSQNAPKEHGYHVLGIISALDGGTSKVTGAYPDTSFIKAVDMVLSPTRRLSEPEGLNIAIQTILNDPEVNYIVNASIGIACGDPLGPCPDATLQNLAYKLITKVRTNGLEDGYLHVGAAGNTSGGFTSAFEASSANYAALRTDIVNTDGHTVLPLSNVVTVENVAIDTASADLPSYPYCLSASSVSGGHVSAPGNEITSFIDAAGTEADKSGTSMAAPQVAAAAAYLWALEPELTPQEIKQRLIATGAHVSGGGSGCSSEDPKPFLDAYRVVLTADDERSLTEMVPVAGRVRGTIMDVADDAGNPGVNGQFDEEDIALFLSVYDAGDAAGELDYSRYDLNGDGWTGGALSETFDLDMDGLIEMHPRQLDGFEHDLDENWVTDKDILCYYAYSGLYTGDTTYRDDMLSERCTESLDIIRGETGVVANSSLGDMCSALDFAIEAYSTELIGPPVSLSASCTGVSASLDITGAGSSLSIMPELTVSGVSDGEMEVTEGKSHVFLEYKATDDGNLTIAFNPGWLTSLSNATIIKFSAVEITGTPRGFGCSGISLPLDNYYEGWPDVVCPTEQSSINIPVTAGQQYHIVSGVQLVCQSIGCLIEGGGSLFSIQITH